MNEDDDTTTEDTRKPQYIQFVMLRKWKRDLNKEFKTVT